MYGVEVKVQIGTEKRAKERKEVVGNLCIFLLYVYTKITEVNLSVFVYRLFLEDLPPLLS